MSLFLPERVREITHGHLFCGMGGGAAGFNAGHARVGRVRAQMRCVGGIDSDASAIEDFTRFTGVQGTVLDLFDRDQYRAWHGHEPPPEWREATPADIRAAFGGERPDIAFTSAPCKGFSGLVTTSTSKRASYQALNRLTLRGLGLLLQAFESDPIPFLLFENVPLIQTRGAALLDQIETLLKCAGYAVVRSTHDAGELGGLAQHRSRFLLVARHRERVPPFLYEPPRQRVRGVGEVLETMPMPYGKGLHRVPGIQWKTWVRLALVEAGKDWRSLQELRVGPDGMLEELALVKWHGGILGVHNWQSPSGAVTTTARPTNGAFAVSDPRVSGWVSERTGRRNEYGQYGVRAWDEPSGAVTSQAAPGSGAYSVADPRGSGWGGGGKYRVSEFGEPVGTVIAASTTGNGAFSVADPRLPCDVNDRQARRQNNVYKVVRWEEAAGAVTGATGNARPNLADPRPKAWREGRTTWEAGGHYGVVRMDEPAGAVTGHASHDNGRWSVADTRLPPLHPPRARLEDTPVIIALDGTWHRPFTTLELAALQGLDWRALLDGGMRDEADGAWRQKIGNVVPPPAAAAIASVMAETILLAEAGETFRLDPRPVWVDGLDWTRNLLGVLGVVDA